MESIRYLNSQTINASAVSHDILNVMATLPEVPLVTVTLKKNECLHIRNPDKAKASICSFCHSPKNEHIMWNADYSIPRSNAMILLLLTVSG